MEFNLVYVRPVPTLIGTGLRASYGLIETGLTGLAIALLGPNSEALSDS